LNVDAVVGENMVDKWPGIRASVFVRLHAAIMLVSTLLSVLSLAAARFSRATQQSSVLVASTHLAVICRLCCRTLSFGCPRLQWFQTDQIAGQPGNRKSETCSEGMSDVNIRLVQLFQRSGAGLLT
jgi:hypothetical protein